MNANTSDSADKRTRSIAARIEFEKVFYKEEQEVRECVHEVTHAFELVTRVVGINSTEAKHNPKAQQPRVPPRPCCPYETLDLPSCSPNDSDAFDGSSAGSGSTTVPHFRCLIFRL